MNTSRVVIDDGAVFSLVIVTKLFCFFRMILYQPFVSMIAMKHLPFYNNSDSEKIKLTMN